MSKKAGALNRLPAAAEESIWQIFGNGESPFTSNNSYELATIILRDRLEEPDEPEKAIAEIQSWFEPDGDRYLLKQEMRNPVDRIILAGVHRALASPSKINNSETAFWAISSVRPDVAAPIVRCSWSTTEIDAFVEYALKILESLHQKGNIIDPKDLVGPRTAGVKAYPSEALQDNLLRTFHVGLDTVYQAYQQMYTGVASVVDLLLKLKPEVLPDLVQQIQIPLLQSFAAHRVAYTGDSSDHRRPLQWVTRTASKELVALAMLHVMETVRKMEFASDSLPSSGTSETPNLEIMADLISDLVSSLASLEPAESTWWVFEWLNYTWYGPKEKRLMVEQVERHCTQLLKDTVLTHWSCGVVNELESGLRRARFGPRGKPLANIAWEIRDGEPERAAEISQIILDEHERRMTDAVKYAMTSNTGFPYHVGNWNHHDWLTALAMSVVISFEETDPTDWAIEKCEALPLSTWDADEEWKIFHVADRVAQTQMTIGLYAVQLLEDAGRSLNHSKLRDFAEKVWCHTDFVRHHSPGPMDNLSTLATLAARVTAAFGEPDQAWVLRQTNNPAVNAATLWALLDQMKPQGSTAFQEDITAEIRQISARRYINAKEVTPQMAPHLANLWTQLDAPEEAAKTAEVLLAYHPAYAKKSNRHQHINRELVALPALKMLAYAENRGNLADDMVHTSRSLYEGLWGRYTPQNEESAREDIDARLNQTRPERA